MSKKQKNVPVEQADVTDSAVGGSANEAFASEAVQTTSPGKQLCEARELLGLTQQQVADRLHLRLISIQALEQDVLEPNVSATFSKGYVRLYAKLVQLEVEPLLALYDKVHAKESQDAKLQSFSRRVTREANDYRWNIVTILVVILVVGSVIVWWVQQSDSMEDSQNFVSETFDSLFSEDDSVPNSNQQEGTQTDTGQAQSNPSQGEQNNDNKSGGNSERQISENNDEQSNLSNEQRFLRPDVPDDNFNAEDNLTDAASDQTNFDNEQDTVNSQIKTQATGLSEVQNESESLDASLSQQNAPPIKTISNASLDESANNPAETSENAVAETLSELSGNESEAVDIIFTFSEDCWVSVKDVNGEVIAIGVKTGGRIMQVSGIPPIDIILCSPQKAAINYNGSDIDLSAFSPNRSANFTLPLTSE